MRPQMGLLVTPMMYQVSCDSFWAVTQNSSTFNYLILVVCMQARWDFTAAQGLENSQGWKSLP